MREQEFAWFRDFVEQKSGIVIAPSKTYLVKSRLEPLVRRHQAADINALILKMKQQQDSPLAHEAIDVMTTNETLFFRDGYPFEALKSHIFPEINQTQGVTAPIKIWSAASSKGQEAYSIAMAACESMSNARQRVRIIGTDLSAEAVAFAQKGVYSDLEVSRGVSPSRLKKFFRAQGDAWVVSDELKAMTRFAKGNLVSDTLASQMRPYAPFDVVFLRNVLIYFSMEERKRVVDRVAQTMRQGSYLITGAADLPVGYTSKWERVTFEGQRLWRLS